MGTEDRHHQRVAEMSLKAALATVLLLCLVSGAPQPQGQSVSCRTEYSVVWDTQYQEKETQECVTNYEKVCHTVTSDCASRPPDRSARPSTRRAAPRCTRVCVLSSTRLSTNLTPRLSALRTTRRTVSSSGRDTVTTRSGLKSPGPASRIPTTSART